MPNKGFTVIEIILIIGILAIIFGLGFPIVFDFYKNYQFKTEQDQFISFLEIARNLSMTNLNQSQHGVFQNNDNFIIFEGNSFATRNQSQDQIFPRSKAVSVSGPSEIIFNVISGQATSSLYIFTNGKTSSNVYVNKEGQIDWQ